MSVISIKEDFNDKVPSIDYRTGNLSTITLDMYYLVDENGNRVSNKYYYLKEIDDEHYIALNAAYNNTVDFLDEPRNTLCYRYGVIKINKKDDNIVSMGEEIVVPFLYTKLTPGNLNTLIGKINVGSSSEYKDERYTYIELDPNNENYGKQIVPAVLMHAEKFEETGIFKNFASCNVYDPRYYIDGLEYRYIPRNCTPLYELYDQDLLTEEEVELYNNPNNSIRSVSKKMLKLTNK